MIAHFTPIAVVCFLWLDIGVNSLADPLDTDVGIIILMTSLQVAMPLCTLTLIFIMFMRTRLMQSGNFGGLLRQYLSFCIISPVHLILLLSSRAWRIDMVTKSTPWELVWNEQGFFSLFVAEKLAMILFYFSCYSTLLHLGNPTLYTQKVTALVESKPEFCKPLTMRQFRSVPEIIRGNTSFEALNYAVTHLNLLVIDKYQLLKTEAQELRSLKVTEEAVSLRKQWDDQEGADTLHVDCFADVDLKLYPELEGTVGKDMLQVLKHLNLVVTLRTTRQYVLYTNSKRGHEVQDWAKREATRLRKVTRHHPKFPAQHHTHIDRSWLACDVIAYAHWTALVP